VETEVGDGQWWCEGIKARLVWLSTEIETNSSMSHLASAVAQLDATIVFSDL
jgi:hypothetical protein